MSQIKPTKGGALFDEIFSGIFAEFFNNYANQSSVINGVWKQNPSLLIRLLSEQFHHGS